MNKVALITGAARGIGSETAKVFASHNYNVVIAYHKEEALALKVKRRNYK